jgi:Mlc titration factor MtfA (ptsG expression regulator)
LPAIAPELWMRVEARLPFLAWLPAAARQRLRELARNFLAEKTFYGARGLRLTDEIMLAIALQACLPIFRCGLDAYRDWVGIVVYPGDFVVPRSDVDDAGVVHEYEDEILGETWAGGPVLLSWFDDEPPAGGMPGDETDVINVVIHEFAHKLDMANGGHADGLPCLPASLSRPQWATVWQSAYARFCAEVEAGVDTALDPYASEDPAEFFAVVSETFFENPLLLRATFPEVYAQLTLCYDLDPAAAGAFA